MASAWLDSLSPSSSFLSSFLSSSESSSPSSEACSSSWSSDAELLEWLSSEGVQTAYTHGTFESPINTKAKADPIVQAWGKFTPSPLNAADIGKQQAEAIRLLDRVGYR